jgi:hypothetical protein
MEMPAQWRASIATVWHRIGGRFNIRF